MTKIIDNREVERIIGRLNKLDKTFDRKVLKQISKDESKGLSKVIKSKIKPGKRKHIRYDDYGNLVATYYPGNLKRSIRQIKHRGSRRSIFVYWGPKVSKKGSGGGVFKGNRVDGWYAHFVEFGLSPIGKSRSTGFMRRSFDEQKQPIKRKLVRRLKQKLQEYKNRYERF